MALPHPRAAAGRCRARGFTLVELLVVVGIIALLISILMPSLTKARRQAAAVQCLSNVKQMVTACSLYLNENKGRGFIYRTGMDDYWIDQLRPHHADVDKIRFCPVTLDDRDTSGWGSATQHWFKFRDGSYGLNGWVYRLIGRAHPDGPGSDGGVNFSRGVWTAEVAFTKYLRTSTRESVKVPVFADAAWPNGWPRQTDTPPINLTDGARRNKGSAPNEHMLARFTINRHDKRVSVGFLDGHAEHVHLSRLKQLKWHEDFHYDDTDWPARLPMQ